MLCNSRMHYSVDTISGMLYERPAKPVSTAFQNLKIWHLASHRPPVEGEIAKSLLLNFPVNLIHIKLKSNASTPGFVGKQTGILGDFKIEIPDSRFSIPMKSLLNGSNQCNSKVKAA